MNVSASETLRSIRDAIASDSVEITSHFDERIGERGLLWIDLLVIFDWPTHMEYQGLDPHGWPKWRIWGATADGEEAAVVVALRDDGRVRFISIHWGE